MRSISISKRFNAKEEIEKHDTATEKGGLQSLKHAN